MYQVYREYLNKRINIEKVDRRAVYGSVSFLQEIFDQFAVYTMARAYDLDPVWDYIEKRDARNRSFTNEARGKGGIIDLYKGYIPPDIMTSWCDLDYNPTFTLHFRPENEHIFFDSKYILGEDELRDIKMRLIALMSAYDIKNGVVITNRRRLRVLEYDTRHGRNYKLAEIGLVPGVVEPDLDAYIATIKRFLATFMSIQRRADYVRVKPEISEMERELFE